MVRRYIALSHKMFWRFSWLDPPSGVPDLVIGCRHDVRKVRLKPETFKVQVVAPVSSAPFFRWVRCPCFSETDEPLHSTTGSLWVCENPRGRFETRLWLWRDTCRRAGSLIKIVIVEATKEKKWFKWKLILTIWRGKEGFLLDSSSCI